MIRTVAVVVAVGFLTVATEGRGQDSRVCCEGLVADVPPLTCRVAGSGRECLTAGGVPVPGSLCCAAGALSGCLATPCYSGPAGTEGVGVCRAGGWACSEGGSLECQGDVTPSDEVCNGIDDDCDGVVDEDVDGDGFTICEDCCETTAQCADPARVNDGAFEIVGNGTDDDCDPTTSDFFETACSHSPSFNVTPTGLANAMDLCRTTTPAARTWGLLSAALRNPDGSAPSGSVLSTMQTLQAAVLAGYGNEVIPERGATMAGLSSGRMRDQNDPGFIPPPGTGFGRFFPPPAAYLAAHGGSFPSNEGCQQNCPPGAGAYDGVNLRLTIRAPTNASAVSFRSRLFVMDYPAYTCSPFGDFHLALLQSGASGLPADRNVARDSLGNTMSLNNAFFETCAPFGCHACPDGTGDLDGTGMSLAGGGAATRWLEHVAPVVAGETITLDLMVFDVGDDIGDAAVLLDDFRWIPAP